jgi:hypothetical protein
LYPSSQRRVPPDSRAALATTRAEPLLLLSARHLFGWLPDLNLSRLITTAWTLAVYASQRRVTRHYARLASGGWLALVG